MERKKQAMSELSSPREVTQKLMKDLKEQAALYGYRKLTVKKQFEVKDYMENRISLWEPDINSSLEL